ncbi:hypothetical protein I4U23_015940 [Adineta vaga]|nr:hypothetical protein I4U23_015940 [Adineta vaga]
MHQMLVNDGFEDGTLAEWQLLCTSRCGSDPGMLTSTSCNTGSFCLIDGCKGGPDFLRQSFSTIMSHIYTVTFFSKITNSNHDAFVRIF